MQKKITTVLIMMVFVGVWLTYSEIGRNVFSVPQAKIAENPVKQTMINTEKPPEKAVVFSGGIPVLMYHSVAEEANNDAVISVARFKEHMLYLKQNEYHPVSLDQLYDYLMGTSGLPAKPVVLTFDDGYRDTYEVVMPILKQYGFKSVLFIPAGDTGQRLTWQEIREMKAAGMEIASHSFHHRDLAGLSRSEQVAEVVKSKEMLDRMLEQNTRYFCYPNSSYDAETLRALRENGFVMAVTTNPGWAKPGDHMLELQRVWVGNGIDNSRLQERLSQEKYSIL